MKDKMKKLGEGKEVPEKVEEEIFNTLDSMKMMTDIFDLFTVKYTQTKAEILGLDVYEHLEDDSDIGKEDAERKNSKKRTDDTVTD